MDEVVIKYANEISRDCIMSLFIAKITSDEYKKDGAKLKGRVLEVLKADLILTVFHSGIKMIAKVNAIQPIVKDAIDEIYKTSLHPKEFVNSFVNEWISKK